MKKELCDHQWTKESVNCLRCGESRTTTTPVNSYKQKKDWEKRFDKKFYKKGTTSYAKDWNVLPEDIKQFISSLIDETEKQAYERGKEEAKKEIREWAESRRKEDITPNLAFSVEIIGALKNFLKKYYKKIK